MLFFWLGHWLRAPARVCGVVAGAREAPMLRFPVRVPAVSPREFTGTAALKRWIPPGAGDAGHGHADTREVFEETQGEDRRQNSDNGVDYG